MEGWEGRDVQRFSRLFVAAVRAIPLPGASRFVG